MSASSFDISRRNVILGSLGAAGWRPWPLASPQPKGVAETLLVVQELGPNSLDMQGVGSNQTVNGLSWNCYDRLLTYASKTLPDGTRPMTARSSRPNSPRAGRSPPTACPALSSCARTRNSTTARLYRQGRQMVVRPRGEGRRLSDLPDVGGLAGKARAVRRGRRPHLPHRLCAQGQDAAVQCRGRRALHHQLRTRQEERDRRRTPGRWPGSGTTRPVAAPTGSRAGSPGARPSSRASTAGRADRCRNSNA